MGEYLSIHFLEKVDHLEERVTALLALRCCGKVLNFVSLFLLMSLYLFLPLYLYLSLYLYLLVLYLGLRLKTSD